MSRLTVHHHHHHHRVPSPPSSPPPGKMHKRHHPDAVDPSSSSRNVAPFEKEMRDQWSLDQGKQYRHPSSPPPSDDSSHSSHTNPAAALPPSWPDPIGTGSLRPQPPPARAQQLRREPEGLSEAGEMSYPWSRRPNAVQVVRRPAALVVWEQLPMSSGAGSKIRRSSPRRGVNTELRSTPGLNRTQLQ